MEDYICPHCGGPIQEKAKFCPHCGSDAETGWSEDANVDWLLPDYEEIVENEFGKPRPKNWFLSLISVIIIIAFVLAFIL